MKNLIWNAIARTLARPAVADRLIAHALKTPYMHILSPDSSEVYMERYWVFNAYDRATNTPKFWWCPWSIRVHYIRREDRDSDHHDHPWNARTIILRGGYTEERLVRIEDLGETIAHRPLVVLDDGRYAVAKRFFRKPGDTATLGFGEYHNIREVGPEGAWTLFISGPWRGIWGFLVNGIKVPWRKYLKLDEGQDIPQEPVAKVVEPVVLGVGIDSTISWQIPGSEFTDECYPAKIRELALSDLGKEYSETQCFVADAASQLGFEGLNADATVYGCTLEGMVNLVEAYAGKLQPRGRDVPKEPVANCMTCGDTGRVRTSDFHGGSLHQPPECDTEPCDMCEKGSPSLCEQGLHHYDYEVHSGDRCSNCGEPRWHSGGLVTGLPDGELPTILSPGEKVVLPMTPLELIQEWRKGCGNTQVSCAHDPCAHGPEHCSECTLALIEAIEKWHLGQQRPVIKVKITGEANVEMLKRVMGQSTRGKRP